MASTTWRTRRVCGSACNGEALVQLRGGGAGERETFSGKSSLKGYGGTLAGIGAPGDGGVILATSATTLARIAAPLAPEALARALQSFLTENPRACVVEDGAVLFDMSRSRWTLDAAGGRCVLQLWSEERNLVRTVVGLGERRSGLRLEVKRFGQTKPQVLRVTPDGDQRTPTAREAMRKQFVAVLRRVLARVFPDLRQTDLFAAADLEHSFGPAYVRGALERGQTAWALAAINGGETQSSIDGIVTVAVLWMEQCRARAGGRRLVEGVKIVVPAGRAAIVRERFAWLHPGIAKWELWEFDELREELKEAEPADAGNLRSHLPPAFSSAAALERLRKPSEQVLALLMPEDQGRTELLPRSATEISFRVHGLEFARVRHGVSATSFAREDRITFGAGASETPLNEETAPVLRELTARLFASRRPGGHVRDPLYRMQPERWLESVLRADLGELEPGLRAEPVYTQVPALASADRGMLDLLAVTREGRLAVLELKASEDLHMPLQGLDYWMRVRALHAAGEISRAGYFPGIELSPEPPLLYFVVTALRVHSTVDTLLKHLAPEVEWRLLALDEKWRRKRAIIFRKSGGGKQAWPRVLAGGARG